MYANDVKLFYSSLAILKDSGVLSMIYFYWLNGVKAHGITLNIKKCICTSFRRGRSIIFSYNLHREPLTSVASFNDLGEVFADKRTFTCHLSNQWWVGPC